MGPYKIAVFGEVFVYVGSDIKTIYDKILLNIVFGTNLEPPSSPFLDHCCKNCTFFLRSAIACAYKVQKPFKKKRKKNIFIIFRLKLHKKKRWSKWTKGVGGKYLHFRGERKKMHEWQTFLTY